MAADSVEGHVLPSNHLICLSQRITPPDRAEKIKPDYVREPQVTYMVFEMNHSNNYSKPWKCDCHNDVGGWVGAASI